MLLFVFSLLLWVALREAAVITWGTPAVISNSAFSGQTGKMIYGGCGNCCTTAGCSITVNTGGKSLAFFPISTGFNSGSTTMVYSPNTNCVASTTTVGGLDSNLATISKNFICDAMPNPQLQIFNLVVGARYTVQILGMDERTCCSSRTQWYTSDGGLNSSSVTFTNEYYVIGTFVADQTSQVVLIKGGQQANNLNWAILRSDSCFSSSPTGYPTTGANGFGGGTGCTITSDPTYPQNAGAVCSLLCLTGYTASSTSWTCNAGGTGVWSSSTGTCTPNPCTTTPDNYPSAGNGFSAGSGCTATSNPSASQANGATCTLVCAAGYTASGSYTCSLGAWTANGNPYCASPCMTTPTGYPAAAIGFASGTGCVATSNPTDSQQSGAVCSVVCATNYNAQGSFTCTDSTWSANGNPSCTAGPCASTPPNYPANGNGFSGGSSCTVAQDPTLPQQVGAVCNLACISGFSAAGWFQCNAGGWASSTSPVPACTAQACTTDPTIGIQFAAGITDSGCVLGSTPSGSVCDITCQNGYQSAGFTFTCFASGWSNTGTNAPSCTKTPFSSSTKAISSSAIKASSSAKPIIASSSAKPIIASSSVKPTSSSAFETGMVTPSSSGSGPPTPDGESSSSSASPAPAVAGAVVGVFVVIALIVLFVRFRKRKQAQTLQQIKKETDVEIGDTAASRSNSPPVPTASLAIHTQPDSPQSRPHSSSVKDKPSSVKDKPSPLVAEDKPSPKASPVPQSRGIASSFSVTALSSSPKASSSLMSGSPKSVSTLALNNSRAINSLAELLESPAGLAAFKVFLVKELSIENLMFWLAVEDYRKRKQDLCTKHKPNDKEVVAAMKPIASKIFQTFLSKTSLNNSNVNLPEDVDERVVRRLRLHFDQNSDQENSDPGKTIFDEAQETIFKLMESDSWKRFQRTNEFAQLKS